MVIVELIARDPIEARPTKRREPISSTYEGISGSIRRALATFITRVSAPVFPTHMVTDVVRVS